jgi:hypothetical protein
MTNLVIKYLVDKRYQGTQNWFIDSDKTENETNTRDTGYTHEEKIFLDMSCSYDLCHH